MKKQYKIQDNRILVHADYHEDHNKDDNAYCNRITKSGVMQFIKDETERLYGRGKNIVYSIATSKGHTLDITKKQFIEMLDQMNRCGKDCDCDYLRPYYDDNDEGVYIYVRMDESKMKKTRIEISC